MAKIVIIGSGFSSLAAASYLAKAGHEVCVVEKNNYIGGRARQLKRDGFTFDMGPSFYWMPDIFERFFADFGYTPNDFYTLEKLDPAYKVYFEGGDSIQIGSTKEAIIETFERVEQGSGRQLKRFLADASDNYDIAIKDLVYRPGESPLELVTAKTVTKLGHFVRSIRNDAQSTVKDNRLRSILEFPVLFLGAKPSNTPAFYNFMNYADFGLGTWHPKKGMYEVAQGMKRLAESFGVEMITNAEVKSIEVEGKTAKGIHTSQGYITADVVLSGADYHHTETLLPVAYRMYSEQYWSKRTFAPSSLLFYVAFDKKLENINHHTLFFDASFDEHAKHIYDKAAWPDKPLFYASFPSVTDDSFAPEGKEAAVFLIPLAPGLEDTPQMREKYFDKIITRLETLTQQSVKSSVLFKESFCVNDFVKEYNSYKGNAYGLANTLFQTAFLRPKLRSKKLNNLFFTGQLTVPGPGVPPALISGQIVSELILKQLADT